MAGRPRPLSGFPEWLPEERLIEQRLLRFICQPALQTLRPKQGLGRYLQWHVKPILESS